MTEPEPRAVSVSLQKGGVGKTTIAINVADRLADRGHEVLLIDLDQQGNATEGIGLSDHYVDETHIGHVLKGDATPSDVIVPSEWGFDVLPSNRELDDVGTHVANHTVGHTLVGNKVIDPLLGDVYDYVIIDAPPNLGPLSDAALFGALNVIIPLQMSEASVGGFERMMEQQIVPIQQVEDLDIVSIVPNRTTGDNEEKRIIKDIEDSPYEEKLPSFGRMSEFDKSPGMGLRDRVAFRRAYRDGKPLSKFDPENDMIPRLDEIADMVEDGGN